MMLFIKTMEEPKLDFAAVVGYALLFVIFLFYLVGLHILVITSDGLVNDVLSNTFVVSLSTFFGFLIFSSVLVLYKILSILLWNVFTPEWKKIEIRERMSMNKIQNQGGRNNLSR